MSEQAAIHPDETRPPQVTDVYDSTHGNLYQVLYCDEQIVLLRDAQTAKNGNHVHRIETSPAFQDMIDQGRMEYKPDSEVEMAQAPDIDWSEVDLIGPKTSDRLNDEGYSNALDIQKASDNDLLDVGGVGDKALRNLKEFAT